MQHHPFWHLFFWKSETLPIWVCPLSTCTSFSYLRESSMENALSVTQSRKAFLGRSWRKSTLSATWPSLIRDPRDAFYQNFLSANFGSDIWESPRGKAKSINFSFRYDISIFVGVANTLVAHAGASSLAYNQQVFALHLDKIQLSQSRYWFHWIIQDLHISFFYQFVC